MDITQRKRVEAELRHHREMLEELVRQRTAELEASYQKLQLADRLASIGTLAAGLGHDMGNLLLPVRVRLDSLDQRLGMIERRLVAHGSKPSAAAGEPHAPPVASDLSAALDDIQAIRTACDYLNRLSQGLRLFALDPEKPGFSDSTDVGAWWRDVESFLRNALPRHVTLQFDLPASLPPLAIAPHAFTQVIYNLVQNAGDAMREPAHHASAKGDRPRVLIRAEQKNSSQRSRPMPDVSNPMSAASASGSDSGPSSDICHLPSETYSDSCQLRSDASSGFDPLSARGPGIPAGVPLVGDDSMVTITVSDNGPGMPPEVLRRCMEPFYSTKTRQISTGLGLALVRGTIYNAGGSIQIESAPGRGTTFRLNIPRAAPPLRRALTAAAHTHPPLAHVIMRDQRLLAYVKSLLEGFGLQVSDKEWSADAAAQLLVWEVESGKNGQQRKWDEIHEFLSRDDRRRAIVIGDGPDHGSLQSAGQIVKVFGGERPTPLHLRKAIREALHANDEQQPNPSSIEVGAASPVRT